MCAFARLLYSRACSEDKLQVMVSHGYRKRACGVVLVKTVKNPIKLAREMLVRGETDGSGVRTADQSSNPSGGAGGAQGHCCLGGETIEELAEEWGLEMVDENYFWTKKRWDEHKRGLRGDSRPQEYLPQGTVGCVVLDKYGTLCTATSTGGLTNKLPCRIGDTPTIGAGFLAEEWDESPLERGVRKGQQTAPGYSLRLGDAIDGVRNLLSDCLPKLYHYQPVSLPPSPAFGEKSSSIRAVAMSGTGNGDSFLRTAAVRTAGAIVRFSPHRSLASAVNQIAGSGGELQRSAGDRWGSGEGEGGIIGIELIDGKGEVVFDFNCGGMFRCWVDELGKERVMVFKDEY